MKFAVIIPARYSSTRFPGKPLALLAGMPVIEHVYRAAMQAFGQACVATDDRRIVEAVERFGGKALMTSPIHKSGTERICEAIDLLHCDADVVVNIQGDEPLVSCNQLQTLCRLFDDPSTQIATLGKPITTIDEVTNPNTPKIVCSRDGFALYFSRSSIPYVRGCKPDEWLNHFTFLKHIGLYAYRTEVLRQIARLPVSPLEQAEQLEQLRWLWGGYRIRIGLTYEDTIGIDTPEDLCKAQKRLISHPQEENNINSHYQ